MPLLLQHQLSSSNHKLFISCCHKIRINHVQGLQLPKQKIRVKHFLLIYLSLAIIPPLPQNVKWQSVCEPDKSPDADQVRSVLALMVEYVGNVKWLEVLGQRLDRGANSWTEGKDGGWDEGRRKAALLRVCGGIGWGCFAACCLLENKQTSDYDINANLNVSQWGAWLSQSGAWDKQELSAAYSSLSLSNCQNCPFGVMWHLACPATTTTTNSASATISPCPCQVSYPSLHVVSLAVVVKTKQETLEKYQWFHASFAWWTVLLLV